MRSVPAIAALTIRSAARSKVVLLLSLCVLAAVGLMPPALRGDGTLHGLIQLLIQYSLGLAVVLLAVAAAWAGAGAVSLEVKGRQAQLLATKPIGSGQLWLGKWLGLLAINGAMLALAGLFTYLAIRWTLRPSAKWTVHERVELNRNVLTARRRLEPEPEPLSQLGRERLDRLRRERLAPDDESEAAVLAQITEDVAREVRTVSPGGRKAWRFRLPAQAADAPIVSVRFTLVTAGAEQESETRGRWLIGSELQPGQHSIERLFRSAARDQVELPAPAVAPGETLLVEYLNTDPAAVTVLFPAEDTVTLLVGRGAFEPNLVRSLLVLFCRLAVLSALGLSACCLFSFPVAVFVSFGLLVAALLSRMVGAYALGPKPAGAATAWYQRAADTMALGVNAFLEPLFRGSPLPLLAQGLMISWESVALTALTAAGYAAILAMFGAALYAKRELGAV